MTKRYKIANYLTEDQRNRACSVPYMLNPRGERVTDDGYCPLGMALQGSGFFTPLASRVGSILMPNSQGSKAFDKLVRAAAEFTHDWDDNYICSEDLPVAFGLRKA
jgi:hypothetical protein